MRNGTKLRTFLPRRRPRLGPVRNSERHAHRAPDFPVASIVAGAFGFTGIPAASAGTAHILFVLVFRG